MYSTSLRMNGNHHAKGIKVDTKRLKDDIKGQERWLGRRCCLGFIVRKVGMDESTFGRDSFSRVICQKQTEYVDPSLV